MTIYRHKKSKKLYKIYRIFGKYLGATYTAEPLHPDRDKIEDLYMAAITTHYGI